MNLAHAVTTILLAAFFSSTVAPASPPGSFWKKIFEVLGITATPSRQRSGTGEQVKEGSIFIKNLETRAGKRIPTLEANYHTPIFLPGGESVLALQGENIVRVSTSNGATEVVMPAEGILRLVAVSKEDPDKVLIIFDRDRDGCPSVALVSMTTKEMTILPKGDEGLDDSAMQYISDWVRVFGEGENVIVFVKVNNKSNMARTDVILHLRDKTDINLSKCAVGKSCGQPSFSDDGKLVAYIESNK